MMRLKKLKEVEYKELKNGKASGLMAVAVVISALWVFAIILVINLL